MLFGGIRLALGLTGATALVARFFWATGEGLDPVSFFGYLTIQSNILFAAMSLVAGVLALKLDRDPQLLTTLRTIVLTMTCTSGVVFVILVVEAQAMGTPMEVPWEDIVLHYVLPLFAVAEWFAAPGRGRGQWRAIPITLGFVGAFGVFTLVRGAVVEWYPYFFLDPRAVSSIGEMAVFCALALAIFSVIGAAVIGLSAMDAVVVATAVAAFATGALVRVRASVAPVSQTGRVTPVVSLADRRPVAEHRTPAVAGRIAAAA